MVRMEDFRLPKKILNAKLDKSEKFVDLNEDGLMVSKLI